MQYLCNALSLNMLDNDLDFALIRVQKISPDEVPEDVISAVGYTDTAAVLSSILGFNVESNRIHITLELDDTLYVAQYHGPRFPEGTIVLPDGATFDFFKVQFSKNMCATCVGMDCNTCPFRKEGFTELG